MTKTLMFASVQPPSQVYAEWSVPGSCDGEPGALANALFMWRVTARRRYRLASAQSVNMAAQEAHGRLVWELMQQLEEKTAAE